MVFNCLYMDGQRFKVVPNRNSNFYFDVDPGQDPTYPEICQIYN
jgi:hypothetical protein